MRIQLQVTAGKGQIKGQVIHTNELAYFFEECAKEFLETDNSMSIGVLTNYVRIIKYKHFFRTFCALLKMDA